MERDEFIAICNGKVKMIRAEYNLTQEKMCHILGISKKTLVEIEKGRSSIGWMGAVTLCSLFSNSEILAGCFGGTPTDIVMALAFDGHEPEYPKTLGGHIWWKNIEEHGGYRLQQNIISQHYRILDAQERRICSSFYGGEIRKKLEELSEENNGEGK